MTSLQHHLSCGEWIGARDIITDSELQDNQDTVDFLRINNEPADVSCKKRLQE